MRTTLDLNEQLLRSARTRAAELGTTLTRLVEDGLRLRLGGKAAEPRRFKLRLLTKRGRVLDGVDLTDRDALYERMGECATSPSRRAFP